MYDIIIIGAGIAGLYSAYNILKKYPNLKFIILEKNSEQYVGGRIGNDIFFDNEIITGAAVGRVKKDILLKTLLTEFNLDTHKITMSINYSHNINKVNIINIMQDLKNELDNYKGKPITFKEFATKILGENLYNDFILTSGYTDYENADMHHIINHYGMEDNYCCWKGFSVTWKILINKLVNFIGKNKIKFMENVVSIKNAKNNKYVIYTDNNKYYCNKIIVATTIETLNKIFRKKTIFTEIIGQPFLRIYGKFTKKSSDIIKNYVDKYTVVTGPLQKIIPININEGVYMIAYNDNKNTIYTKKFLNNKAFFCREIEKEFGILNNSLELIAIKNYFWNIGTHYYKPLDTDKYKNRQEFIYTSQRPYKNIFVVGEVVSLNQGWVEGALMSVKNIINEI